MPPTTIGLIGDIHCRDDLLERCLGDLQQRRVELILSVGDIVDGRGDVNRCCRLLQAAQVVSVRGNHERWLLEDAMRDLPDATELHALGAESLAYLRSLPPTRTLEVTGGKLLLGHGLGAHDMVRLLPDDEGYALQSNFELEQLLLAREFRWVVGGHTHVPMVRSFDGPLTVINPGALGEVTQPTYAVLDTESERSTLLSI